MVSAGPNSGSTFVSSTESGSGSNAWASPGNVAASDDARATSTASSQWLKATGFSFAVPSLGTILGIEIEVEGVCAALAVAAIKGGAVQSNISAALTGEGTYKVYGSPTTLWGTTWTPADINAATFGAALWNWQVANSASVDHVRIIVYYSLPFMGDGDESTPQVLSQRRSAVRLSHELLNLRRIAAMAAEFLPFRSPETSRELQWRMGGQVVSDRELQWRLGGTVSHERTLQWRVAPSPLRVHYALTGRSGPVSYTFRFERRTIANQFLEDVTPAFLGGSIEANNDRDVFRTATFTVDASALDDRGNAVTIDPLADHIAVFMDLLVDCSYTLGLPMGLFALNVPRKRFEPGGETWEIAASDNGIHLMEATTTASYTVAAAENYITGTNAVRAILDDLGLAHALPTTALTLPVARTWAAGTPWMRVVNDLLHAAGMYSLWFDASGIARARAYDDLSTRTPDVTYTGDDFVLIPITEEAETTRLANQVVAVVNDPGQAPLTSTKTNADSDSPISTVSLGRTITKVIQSDAADQATLDAIAENYLRNEAGWYNRVTLLTSIDPRREAHEVYELTVDGVYAAQRWWSRNWRVQLDIGAQHTHTLGKVERVVAS